MGSVGPQLLVFGAFAGGYALGLGANEIDLGHGRTFGTWLSDAVANQVFSSKIRESQDFINKKVATVQEHVGRYAAPDPEDPNDRSRKQGIFQRMKKHLEQAKNELRHLPDRQRGHFDSLLKRTEEQLDRWFLNSGGE